jgi:alpha-L-fucosidase
MNRNWGYNSHDHDFKSVDRLIGLLVETASKGGNLLLNVGPKPDGTFPEESVERLRGIGKWMRVNGGAIYGSRASLFKESPFRSTTQSNRINLFLTEWKPTVLLPGLKTPITRAYLPADPAKRALSTGPVSGGVQVTLPGEPPDVLWPVVVCEFDRTPEVS